MTYEYSCSHCKYLVSYEQRITDKPKKKCPKCKKNKLKRLVSCSSFVLQGSGWYRDGYK